MRRQGTTDDATPFLAWRFKEERPDLAELCFADFLNYVKVKALMLKAASVGVMNTALRSLVRFWEFKGYCRPGLSRAWPKMPNWKRSPPLDTLTRRECRDLLRVVDRNEPSGRSQINNEPKNRQIPASLISSIQTLPHVSQARMPLPSNPLSC